VEQKGKTESGEDIYKAAVACFNENGYYNYRTSMSLIAERANMTKCGLEFMKRLLPAGVR